MRVSVCCYSKTGTTRSAAREAAGFLARAGHDVVEIPLEPRFELPYPLWLALSFFPRSRFPLRPTLFDPARFDGCLLAVPKWTFSCPPVNSFLALHGRTLPPTALVVTYGGWDHERYAAALASRLASLGVSVRGTWLFKKKRWESGEGRGELEGCLRRCFPP